MEPLSVAKACAAVIDICIKVSSVLNTVLEDGGSPGGLTRQPLKEVQSAIRVLDSVRTALARFSGGEAPWGTMSPNYNLGNTMEQAVNRCGAAAMRFSEILGPIQHESRPLGTAGKVLADNRLRERSGEVLQTRHQIQTYTAVLQMGLRMTELSILLQDERSPRCTTKEVLTKVSRLRRSIRRAERILSYPIKDDDLEESGTKALKSCAGYARAVLRSADSILNQSRNSTNRSSEREKTTSGSHWGFTFLDCVEICEESDSGDPPVEVEPMDSRARIEAWITRPTPSDVTEADFESLHRTALAPSELAKSRPSDLAYLNICEDDNLSAGSSEDSLNLGAGLARIFVEMGDECFGEESMMQAEIYYRKALDRVEASSTGLDRRLIEQKIGVACLEQGKYDAAEIFFDKYPDLAGPMVEKIITKGRGFYDRGQFRYAANCFRRAISNASRLPRGTIREVSMLAGLSSLALDELDGARDHFLKTLNSKDNIDDSRALEAKHHLSIVAMKQGDLDQALSYCQKASDGYFRLLGRDHADSQTSLALLAEIYEARGDSAEVDGHLKLLTPENSKATLTRIRLRRLKRRLGELRHVDRASQSANCIVQEKQLDDFLDRAASRIDQPLEPTEQDEQDTQCLITAIEDRNLIILRSLLQLPDLDAAHHDSSGQTALHHAVHRNDKQVMEILIQHMTKGFDVVNADGETALLTAVRNRADAMVLRLLGAKQVNVNYEHRREDKPKVQSNGPALHMAIKLSFESTVAILLQSIRQPKLSINFRDLHGRCPVHYALCRANGNIINMLLACPDINVNNVTEPEKQTPLSLAIINGQYRAASTLIARRDVDVNRRDFHGNSALHHTAGCNEPQIMAHLLMRKSLNVNARDLCGRTALHIAAVYGNIALVKLLAAHKAIEIKIENKYGETPRQAALSANQKAVSSFLDKMECDAHVRDRFRECGISI